jgi:hypothetical protein
MMMNWNESGRKRYDLIKVVLPVVTEVNDAKLYAG